MLADTPTVRTMEFMYKKAQDPNEPVDNGTRVAWIEAVNECCDADERTKTTESAGKH